MMSMSFSKIVMKMALIFVLKLVTEMFETYMHSFVIEDIPVFSV